MINYNRKLTCQSISNNNSILIPLNKLIVKVLEEFIILGNPCAEEQNPLQIFVTSNHTRIDSLCLVLGA